MVVHVEVGFFYAYIHGADYVLNIKPPPVLGPDVHCKVINVRIGMDPLKYIHLLLTAMLTLSAGGNKVVGVNAFYQGCHFTDPFFKSRKIFIGKSSRLIPYLP